MGILVFTAPLCMPAYAQQAVERGVSQGGQSQPAKKPAKPVRPAAKPAGAVDMRAPQTRQWTLDDALPSRRPHEPGTVSSPGLGRVPVEGGSFGFSADQQMDPYKTPDGSRIRGLERTGESGPSYLGLSLSVPTNEKSVLPRSILPNW